MTTLTEGALEFSFCASCVAVQYDQWAFFRKQFQKVGGGSKAVDFLCSKGGETWLIEVKDYRVHPRTKPSCLSTEVAKKVRDTLAGLVAASANANVPSEQQTAQRALRSKKWRVVLHLEQPTKTSKLKPKAITPMDVYQQLKRILKAVDPHPKVVDRNSLTADMCWTVSSKSEAR